MIAANGVAASRARDRGVAVVGDGHGVAEPDKQPAERVRDEALGFHDQHRAGAVRRLVGRRLGRNRGGARERQVG